MSEPDFSTAGNPRSLRGLHLAQTLLIKPTKKGWHVPSESGGNKYVVAFDLSECTCPDYSQRLQPCKHVYAVQHMLEGIEEADEELPLKAPRATYPQKWPEYNAAQTTEKGNFLALERLVPRYL